MPEVTAINGAPVVKEPINEKLQSVIDNLYDIGSSGEMGELADSEWRMNELKELFSGLSVIEKHSVFAAVMEAIENSDGWYVHDIRTLMEFCDVEKCSIDF
jgi:hypothetical protein